MFIPSGKIVKRLNFFFRAGYLTMFERRDNAAAVYKEFRKFDDLLTKLARRSLKRGKLCNSKIKVKLFFLICNFLSEVISTQHSILSMTSSSSLTEESKVATSSREQLWELLSPNWLSGGSESHSWQQSYCHFLQEEGVDSEMQKRALLLQLWTTQVREVYCLSVSLTHPQTTNTHTTTQRYQDTHCKPSTRTLRARISLHSVQPPNNAEVRDSAFLCASCATLPASTCYSQWSFYILVICICFHDTL